VLHLRQPYLDLWILDEIFRGHAYEYPDEVRRILEMSTEPLRIVDIGSCVGLASIFFLSRFPDARITAFEPDVHNRKVLMDTVRANRLEDRWRVIAAAAATREGQVPFVSDHFLSHIDPNRDDPRAAPVATVDVFPHVVGADVVKMDIQGAEWEILADPRFKDAGIKTLVVEYHPYQAPSPDPEAAAIGLLRGAGYRVSPTAGKHAGEGTVWGWRPS
jgi:FkbM family methyltransferase